MPSGRRRTKKGIYPNLEKWLKDNGKTYYALATETGINHSTVYGILYGDRGCTKYSIDAILRVTGMTYEEAFKEE